MSKTYQLYEAHETAVASLVLPVGTVTVAVDQSGAMIGHIVTGPDEGYKASIEPLQPDPYSITHPEYIHAAYWLMSGLEDRGYTQE